MNPANFSLSTLEMAKNKEHPLHKGLHMPDTAKQIFSKNHVEQLPSAWYGLHWGEFLSSPYDPTYSHDDSLPQRVSYKLPDSNISATKSVSLIVTLPPIHVAEEYLDKVRVSWSPEIAFAVIDEATIDCGGAKPFRYNRHTMKVLLRARRLFTEDCKYNVGARAELNTWGTELPAAQVGFTQPFYFQDLECGLLCYTEKPVSFDYAFVLHTLKVLRCERRESVDAPWKSTKPQRVFFRDFQDKFSPPQLIGKFLYTSKFSVASFRGNEKHSIKFTDVLQVSAPNATDCRQLMQATLEREKNVLVKGIFVVVEDATSRQLRGEWTDYTDNIVEVKVSYDEEPRVVDRVGTLHGRIINEQQFGFVLPPWLKGISFVEDLFDNMETDVAFQTLDGKLDIQLRQDDDDTGTYRYHSFFVVQRVITYENVGHTKRTADDDVPKHNITLRATIQT